MSTAQQLAGRLYSTMADPERATGVVLDDRGLASLDLATLDRLAVALKTPIPKTAPALQSLMETRWYAR